MTAAQAWTYIDTHQDDDFGLIGTAIGRSDDTTRSLAVLWSAGHYSDFVNEFNKG